MRELNSEERDSIVNKIRSEYRKYSIEAPNMFKLLPFEQRYTQILKEHANLEKFLNEEVLYIEKLKKLWKLKKARKEIRDNSPIDRILAEQEAAIQKYKKIDFHPQARNELKYFYGAITEYTELELIALDRMFRGTPEMKDFLDPILQIEKVGIARKNTPSIRIMEHLQTIISTNAKMEILEKDSQEIIKNTCISLFKISRTLDELNDKNLISHTMEIKAKETDSRIFINKFSGLPYTKVVEKIVTKNNEIISDFRMTGILSMRKN